MANATIQSLTETQTGNFTIEVSFDTAVSGLEKTDFDLRGLTENGATGVDFSISGVEPTISFMLMFTLPTTAEGSFEISITGMVTPEGESTPEAVMATPVIIYYDTTVDVTATFGAVTYPAGGVISVAVTFGESVIATKSVFALTLVTRDMMDYPDDDTSLAGIEYVLLGEGTDYELIFDVPPDRVGAFELSGRGDVFKTATGVWENVVITPSGAIPYNTLVPGMINYYGPRLVAGEIYDIKFEFNCVVEGFHQEIRRVIHEFGAMLPTPVAYKWVGDTEMPPRTPTLTDDIRGTDPPPTTDWVELQSPPMDHPEEWYGESLKYLLLRYSSVPDAEVQKKLDVFMDRSLVQNRGY